jgi:hypothetical protein
MADAADDAAVDDAVISRAVQYLKGQILSDGTVPGDHNGAEGNANTTAMAAMALKAAGEEPAQPHRQRRRQHPAAGTFAVCNGGQCRLCIFQQLWKHL